MSSSATSGRSRPASSSACAPSRAISVLCPCIWSSIASESAPSSLSSAMRMRRLRAGAGAGTTGATIAAASSSTGSRSTNSLPRPMPSLCAATEPPCISTRRRTSERPMPSPPTERSSEVSIWMNLSKMRGSCSLAMPRPQSRTRTTASLPRRSTPSRMRPPGCMNLHALLRRFAMTWQRRVRSAMSHTGCSGNDRSRRWPMRLSSASTLSIAFATMTASSTRSRWSSSLSSVMRLTSMRSSTSRTMWSTWRSIMAEVEPTSSASPPARLSRFTPVRIGASGFRSSCASTARKWFLRRSTA